MPIWIARILEIVLVGGILAGVGVSVWLVAESRSPQPGANMVLMGLPPVAGIMLLLAICLLALRYAFGSRLTAFENMMMLALPVAVLVPVAFLVVLG